MAGPLLIPLLAASASAACPDFDQQLEWAQDELLEINDRAAFSALRQAEDALGCGSPRSSEQIARFFLIDGAIAQLQGDPEATKVSFAAAARADKDVWLDALGPALKQTWTEAARTQVGLARLDVETADGWTVQLNATERRFPTEVPAGLHVVQVVHGSEVGFGRVIEVVADEDQVVVSGVEARAAVVAEAPAPSAEILLDPGPAPVRLSAGLGVNAALGQSLDGVRADGTAVSEPGAKLTVPLEVGAVILAKPLWIRPTVGLAPLLGGRFLFATEDGAGAAGFAVQGNLSAGVAAGPVDVGGLVGIAYPGRIPIRGLVGLPLGDTPLYAEARAGLNLATGGRFEPALGAALSARVP